MQYPESTIEKKLLFIADPKIVAMPIKENHEPLIDLKDQDLLAFGPSPEIPNNTDYTKMRKTVYEKLLQAQALLPNGIRFRVYECHRSIGLQENLFQDRYNVLLEMHPTWSHTEIFIETTRLVSPVINLDGTRNIPAHSTGAAVDLYLIDDTGEPLEMGIKVEDWALDVDGSLSITNSTKISAEAQKNRSIMNAVLIETGFVNYFTEFWHWSYGDRYWAYYKDQPYAVYGTA